MKEWRKKLLMPVDATRIPEKLPKCNASLTQYEDLLREAEKLEEPSNDHPGNIPTTLTAFGRFVSNRVCSRSGIRVDDACSECAIVREQMARRGLPLTECLNTSNKYCIMLIAEEHDSHSLGPDVSSLNCKLKITISVQICDLLITMSFNWLRGVTCLSYNLGSFW
ncbi:hypothetical protein CAPTEDRAFT_192108 [Capitella teleta]|uniref:Uncharacterized protein n=1 Tax=Capitella teleta TaxID=283909 RepID=R7TZG8_CAPTE|nr:hypothetical protein CAPTEDRAFT_192108 [Capitella teleta]|eukprot:ELT96300.1 hypothetical protein CAPTEDRAFT_192108 [Capitella teleta]